jgi:thiol:disulfide interchange protein
MKIVLLLLAVIVAFVVYNKIQKNNEKHIDETSVDESGEAKSWWNYFNLQQQIAIPNVAFAMVGEEHENELNIYVAPWCIHCKTLVADVTSRAKTAAREVTIVVVPSGQASRARQHIPHYPFASMGQISDVVF